MLNLKNMATNRELLQKELQRAGQITQSAVSGQGFDPRGGYAVLAAQLGTAAIGAFAQKKAKDQLIANEAARKQKMGMLLEKRGLSADLAESLSPASQDALLQQIVKSELTPPTALSPEGKRALDVRSGILPKGPAPETEEQKLKKSQKAFDQTTKLRNEFVKQSGEFVKSQDAFDRVQASAQDPSPAGDMALIFNFMKVLDPGSTVREGEFANAQSSGSVPEKIWGQYNQVLKGERLAPTVRGDFVNRSKVLFGKAVKGQNRRRKQYTGLAKRNKLPVNDVVIDLGSSEFKATPKATPIESPPQGEGIKFLGFE